MPSSSFTRSARSAAKNILPHGTVAADGSFAIGTYKDDDGAPPGEYSVTMNWAESKLDPKGTGDTIQVDRFLGQYSDPTKSRWKVQIRKGDNTIGPFVLE